MRAARNISFVVAALALAGCAKQKPPAPVVPQAPAAIRKTPKPGIPASQPAAQITAPASPLPAASLPARPPLTLESRTDPVVDRPSVEGRIRNLQAMSVQLNARNLAGSAKDDRDRVASLLDLARKALASGDLRQANDLSSRGETLARTLLNAR